MRRGAVATLLCLGLAAGCAGTGPAPGDRHAGDTTRPTATRPSGGPTAPPGPSGPTQLARVTRITDGDTIRVSLGGREERLRYIGIDTPESVAPGQPVEPWAREAMAANARLVEGREVTLERDVSETDRFGRLLRYVWLSDDAGRWLLVNLELVREGYAQVATYPPDVRHADLFLAAERDARKAGRGLWGDPEPSS